MMHVVCWHCLVNACMLKVMSPSRWTHTTNFVCRPFLMFTSIRRCHEADLCRPWVMSPSQWAQVAANVCIPWLLLLAIWGSRFADARRAQLVFPGWCAHTKPLSNPVYGSMTWFMCAGVAWCYMSQANFTCQMCTCNIIACRPLLMQHGVFWRFLGDTHIPRLCLQS